MTLKSTLRCLALSVSLSAAFVAASPAVAQTVWDMPTPYPVSNFHTENIQQFVDDIAAGSDGKLKITVHSNGSLFKANEIRSAVQRGRAQIGEAILIGMANEDAFFALDGIPFLARGYEDAKRLADASRPILEARFDKMGLKLLYMVPWQPQGIYSKKEVSSATDLKGLKIRSYSPTVARLIELMGAQPVTVQAADLTQALATGVVEANLTSSATGYDSKSWEQLSWYANVKAWLPKNAVFVRKRDFDALEPAVQQAVLKAAAAAETRGWKVSEEKDQWYLDQLRANGMNVTTASEGLSAELSKIGDTMTTEWAKQVGEAERAVLDAYRAGAN